MLFYFSSSLINHDFDLRSQECEKAKTSAPIISQSIQSIWIEFAILLRLASEWTSYSFYLVHWTFKGENPTYMISLKSNNNNNENPVTVCLYWDIYRSISFTLGLMIETIKFYILISVWMTLTFIHGHSCIRNNNLIIRCTFKCRFRWKSVCCHSLLVCWSSF